VWLYPIAFKLRFHDASKNENFVIFIVIDQWMYLYHAVDSDGNTIDFFLSKMRDIKLAKRFLKKALALYIFLKFPRGEVCPKSNEFHPSTIQ
jgi:hypothetical protein